MDIIWTSIASFFTSLWGILCFILEPVYTNVLVPVGHFFAFIYNFIEHNDFFMKNAFNFIIVAGSFIFAYFALNVTGIFEKKSKEISDTIKNSEDKKATAISHLEETKNSLKNVDKDIAKIVSDAKELAQVIAEKSDVKLKAELDNLKERENILKDGYEKKAEKEVFIKISNAAISVSKEYIENSLDENTHKELIYDFINNLDNMRVE